MGKTTKSEQLSLETGETGDISRYLQSAIQSVIDTKITDTQERFERFVEDKKGEVESMLLHGAKLVIKNGTKQKTLTGLKHEQLPKLIGLAFQRIPVLMVGVAGTGKTHAAEQVSEALGLKFYAMSVGAQTSKSDIVGYMHANGGYVTSHFREAYEHGGVFLMDEIDAGNANVLIQVNAALSNQYCAFPDKMVKRHKDFVFIASANTYGNGANRMYVGRNQLDAATLDRFAVLDWKIDTDLEQMLVKNLEHGDRWLKVVWAVREYVDKQKIRSLVTPRATLRGALLLSCGDSFDHVLQVSLLSAQPADKQDKIKEIAKKAWG